YGSLANVFVQIHTLQGNILKKNAEPAKIISNDAIIKNSNYNNIFDYSILYGETDYYPKVAFDNLKDSSISAEVNPKINSILSHEVIINGERKVTTPKVAANYIEYNVKTNKKERTVIIDGNKGKNIVSVTYQPSKLLYIGMIISVVTWIGLFIILWLKNLNVVLVRK